MEQLQQHFSLHSSTYKHCLLEALKALIGTVMVGISLSCLHLLYFLLRIYRMARDSREYMYKREHLQTQMLVRYLLTVLCIATIDFLLFVFFQDGPRMVLVGLALCILAITGRYAWNLIKPAQPAVKIRKE